MMLTTDRIRGDAATRNLHGGSCRLGLQQQPPPLPSPQVPYNGAQFVFSLDGAIACTVVFELVTMLAFVAVAATVLLSFRLSAHWLIVEPSEGIFATIRSSAVCLDDSGHIAIGPTPPRGSRENRPSASPKQGVPALDLLPLNQATAPTIAAAVQRLLAHLRESMLAYIAVTSNNTWSVARANSSAAEGLQADRGMAGNRASVREPPDEAWGGIASEHSSDVFASRGGPKATAGRRVVEKPVSTPVSKRFKPSVVNGMGTLDWSVLTLSGEDLPSACVAIFMKARVSTIVSLETFANWSSAVLASHPRLPFHGPE